MKVKILGTGSIYSKSNCASLIINEKVLIDIGPGVTKQLIKENYNLLNIDTILITHLHSDHILDFPTFIVNVEVLGLNHKINIYSPIGAKEKLLKLLNLMYGDYFNEFVDKYLNFIVIKDNMIIDIDKYNIKVKEVVHIGIESYGFIINSRLGITGDSSLCDSVKEIVYNSDVIICDCSIILGDNYHMGINDIKTLLEISNAKQFILTHFREITKENLRNLKLDNVSIVDDGYEFELEE